MFVVAREPVMTSGNCSTSAARPLQCRNHQTGRDLHTIHPISTIVKCFVLAACILFPFPSLDMRATASPAT